MSLPNVRRAEAEVGRYAVLTAMDLSWGRPTPGQRGGQARRQAGGSR